MHVEKLLYMLKFFQISNFKNWYSVSLNYAGKVMYGENIIFSFLLKTFFAYNNNSQVYVNTALPSILTMV